MPSRGRALQGPVGGLGGFPGSDALVLRLPFLLPTAGLARQGHLPNAQRLGFVLLHKVFHQLQLGLGEAAALGRVLVVQRELSHQLPPAIVRAVRPRHRLHLLRDHLHVLHGLGGREHRQSPRDPSGRKARALLVRVLCKEMLRLRDGAVAENVPLPSLQVGLTYTSEKKSLNLTQMQVAARLLVIILSSGNRLGVGFEDFGVCFLKKKPKPPQTKKQTPQESKAAKTCFTSLYPDPNTPSLASTSLLLFQVI